MRVNLKATSGALALLGAGFFMSAVNAATFVYVGNADSQDVSVLELKPNGDLTPLDYPSYYPANQPNLPPVPSPTTLPQPTAVPAPATTTSSSAPPPPPGARVTTTAPPPTTATEEAPTTSADP